MSITFAEIACRTIVGVIAFYVCRAILIVWQTIAIRNPILEIKRTFEWISVHYLLICEYSSRNGNIGFYSIAQRKNCVRKLRECGGFEISAVFFILNQPHLPNFQPQFSLCFDNSHWSITKSTNYQKSYDSYISICSIDYIA